MKDLINDLADRIAADLSKLSGGSVDSIFADAKKAKEDIKKNIYAILEANLAKMNLVSSEEFTLQNRKLTKLEARLSELERELAKYKNK